jgi:hypothetical protein
MKRRAQIPSQIPTRYSVVVDTAAHPNMENGFTPSAIHKELIAVDQLGLGNKLACFQ